MRQHLDDAGEVAVGAAAFVDLAMHLAGADGAVRVIAYVVSGIGFLGAGAIILATGVRDDVKEVSPPGRVLATVAAGMVLVQFGVTMFYFRIPFLGVVQLSSDWMPITEPHRLRGGR